jgi:hypothetical protein
LKASISQRQAHIFSKRIANLIQILSRQKRFFAPFPHAPLVGLLVMQRKDRIDILPLSMSGGDARTALRLWNRNQMVDNTKPLSF